jgi:hypothetical protein
MANTREKGKIARSEWAEINARYQRGEAIAQIARDYHCTAPAIRYIVKRSAGLGDAVGAMPAREEAELPAEAERSSVAGGAETSSVLPLGRRKAERLARGTGKPGQHLLGMELRNRVAGDIASFLVALDHAVLEGSLESIAELQDASDRLMRSTARTRLELDRLLDQHGVAADELRAAKGVVRSVRRHG